MRFEEVLEEAGSFSKFQFLVLHLLCLPRVILPLNFLLHSFISGVPPHRCALPHLGDQPGDGVMALADQEKLTQNLPQEPDGSLSSCQVYGDPGLALNSSSNGTVRLACSNGWVYNRTQFYSTTATQVDPSQLFRMLLHLKGWHCYIHFTFVSYNHATVRLAQLNCGYCISQVGLDKDIC